MAKQPSDPQPTSASSDLDAGVSELDDGYLVDPAVQGMTTTAEVLVELRRRALARSNAAPQKPPADVKQTELARRRRSTLSFFLEQRHKEFTERSSALSVREGELGEARRTLQLEAVEGLVEFLGLMSGGAETPEAREVIAEHTDLLETLGVSVDELLRRVRARR